MTKDSVKWKDFHNQQLQLFYRQPSWNFLAVKFK